MSQFVFSPNAACQIVWKKGRMLDFYARPSLEHPGVDATIELWSNLTHSKEWKGFRFTKVNEEYILTINTMQLACDDYEFTMRYRPCNQDSWIWCGEPNQNGHIRLVPTQDINTQPNIPTFASVPQLCFVNREQSSIADLWHFRTQTKNETFSLGKINLPIQHYVAFIHKSAHWLTPVSGSFGFHRNDDEKWQVIMYQDSLYGHIHLWMAVGPSACWFSPGDNHSLQFHHTPQDTDHLLIVTIQKRDFSSLMKTALHYASTVIFKSELFPELPSDPVLSDKLGYCTWNAFGTENLCLDNLLLALDSLQQADIPIDYLLLDDGWQEIQDSMLSSFDAIKSKFPGCLKHTVEVLKGKYPSLKHIGVWHALWGYWKGIDKKFASSNQYGPQVVKQEDSSSVGLIEEVEKFYFDFYKFLQLSGIDFAKVDSQGSFHNLAMPIKEKLALWDRYRKAMVDGSDEFLSSRIIHCMSFTPHVLFQPILSAKTKTIFRNSDDFFPNEKDSHSWHIYANAINSLWTHNYSFILDWDMFQTDHPFAEYHASSRAISGGPVYITDYPGKHNIKIVQKLIAETRHNGHSLLRSYQSSHPTFNTVFENPMGNQALLELCNLHYEQCSERSFSKPEYGICGFWNTSDKENLGVVETSMFHTKKLSIVPTVAYIITGPDRGKVHYLGLENSSSDSSDDEIDYGHVTSSYCLPSVNAKRTNTKLSVRVGSFGSCLVSVSPVRSWGAVSVSCLGLIDKYNGTRAILKTRLVEVNQELCDIFEAELSHRSASCGFWIASNVWSCCRYKTTPRRVFVDDMELKTSDWSWSPETGLLVVNMMNIPLDALNNDYFRVQIHITSINNT